MTVVFEPEACIKSAVVAWQRAYSPYVKSSAAGAAFLTDQGIFNGSTLQTCAYPTSICATQAAAVNALSNGARVFLGLAFVGIGVEGQLPHLCGRCREIIWQLGVFPIVVASPNKPNDWETFSINFLLPKSVKAPPLKVLDAVNNSTLSCFKEDQSVPSGTAEYAVRIATAQAALKASQMAYAPVSNFPVGAAVATEKGIYSGCNCEHPNIGLGLCAERVALSKAVSAGARKIFRLAVVCVLMKDFASPCGACRQCLVEFGNFPVDLIRLSDPQGDTTPYSLKECNTYEMLPMPFTPAAL